MEVEEMITAEGKTQILLEIYRMHKSGLDYFNHRALFSSTHCSSENNSPNFVP